MSNPNKRTPGKGNGMSSPQMTDDFRADVCISRPQKISEDNTMEFGNDRNAQPMESLRTFGNAAHSDSESRYNTGRKTSGRADDPSHIENQSIAITMEDPFPNGGRGNFEGSVSELNLEMGGANKLTSLVKKDSEGIQEFSHKPTSFESNLSISKVDSEFTLQEKHKSWFIIFLLISIICALILFTLIGFIIYKQCYADVKFQTVLTWNWYYLNMYIIFPSTLFALVMIFFVCSMKSYKQGFRVPGGVVGPDGE